RIMDFITTAERADDNVAIRLPGHEFTKLLDDNRRHGITIDDSIISDYGMSLEPHSGSF
ncbi:hypothetical protein MJI47_27370, partial [Salmonella enterica subsp. enterica serovar Kentucky]|nr:hypothetical protein [Salmonella enterica subsp. enterica serovar Kentucky]